MGTKKPYTIVISRDETDGGFIGVCDELNAFSQGETFGEVMENAREAVGLASKEVCSTGEFDMLVIQKHK